MSEAASAGQVFLSYAGTERDQALRLRETLENLGVEVLMDDGFEPGDSVMVNVGRAVDGSGVVLALVSSDYLDRKFTEIEVSAVMASPGGKLLPVIIGPEPKPTTARGRSLWTVLRGRSYFRLETIDSPVEQLIEAISEKTASSSAPVVDLPITKEEAARRRLLLVYDWEDGHLAEQVEAQLAAGYESVVHAVGGAKLSSFGASGTSSQVGILWTHAAQASPEVAAALMSAVTTGYDVAYLLNSDSPAPPSGARIIRLTAQHEAQPQASTRYPSPRSRDRHLLNSQVNESIRINDNIPFHLLGDKFCANRDAAVSAKNVYQTAVYGFPPHDEARLAAVLGYAAVCRFRGDWQTAGRLLSAEPLPEAQKAKSNRSISPSAIAIEADQLSLDFELGRVAGIGGRAEQILTRALAAGEWPVIIGAQRQLGMINEEQGNYSAARDCLARAAHYSEDLLDTALLAERLPERDARVCLWVDCLRELAALEWRAGGPKAARGNLELAVEALGEIDANHISDYLMHVIGYQRARVEYSLDHDYEAAKDLLQSSYLSLQKYDNPIRLATVLEALVRLEMDFLRKRDEKISLLRPTLEKIRRVRHTRGHDYMIARTTEALGDLEFALGNLQKAIEQYDIARREFNRLGKSPEAVNTARSLSRCYTRLGDSTTAAELLEGSLEELREPDHHEMRAEIRSEIVRLLHKRLSPSQVDSETEMTGVGEFAVHGWIARGLTRIDTTRAPNVVLGVGDDAAVLRVDADEEFVVSTDSVPPALLSSDDPASATYAARFAVVSSLSDVISMGADPIAVLINLHLRRATPASWVKTFLRASAEEAARYGASVVGGDLKERDREALTMVAIGKVHKGDKLTRAGARPGDMLGMTLSAGPDELFSGLGTRWAHELVPYLSQSEKPLVHDLARDDAKFSNLGLPSKIMKKISEQRLATAAMDTSDGVLGCAQLIGEASNVGIELFPERMDELINEDVRNLASSLGIAPFLFALNAGHDWEIVFTVPKDKADEVEALGRSGKSAEFPHVAIVGKVVERASWSEEGVRLVGPRYGTVILPFFTDEKFVPQPYQLRPHDWLDFARESTRLVEP